MAKYGTTFANNPLICHPIDTPEEIANIIESLGLNLKDILDRYYRSTYKDYIEPLFFNSSYPMNLGGESEKQKIITTDKSTGIFDFSLASKTLQKDVEYYSPILAQEYPKRFENMGLLSGLVPSDYVTNFPVQGSPNYIFEDKLLQKDFICQQRQKGETEVEAGVQGASLAFKSQTRKIYKTYRRKKGKVKYVELYSLFYFSIFDTDVQYAIRHLPVFLAAQYFESIGIKTRIYLTRFVQLGERYSVLREDSVTKYSLPLYDMVENLDGVGATRRQTECLFVQPFCCKDYGSELDLLLGCAVSQSNSYQLYQPLAEYAISRESNITGLYGEPNWQEQQYWEGVERYRNKYKLYSELGIYSAKEVQPEAMIFFHDYSIRSYLSQFETDFYNYLSTTQRNITQDNVYQNPLCNLIFTWWMRLCGIKIKHKINLLNSISFSKDIRDIDRELEEIRQEAANMVDAQANNVQLQRLYRKYTENIITIQKMTTLQNYITALNNEITSYAQNAYFETDMEEIEKRDDFAQQINEALINYI